MKMPNVTAYHIGRDKLFAERKILSGNWIGLTRSGQRNTCLWWVWTFLHSVFHVCVLYISNHFLSAVAADVKLKWLWLLKICGLGLNILCDNPWPDPKVVLLHTLLVRLWCGEIEGWKKVVVWVKALNWLKVLNAVVDSTAVSICVDILVDLTNTVFVNSTNISKNIETAVLSTQWLGAFGNVFDIEILKTNVGKLK